MATAVQSMMDPGFFQVKDLPALLKSLVANVPAAKSNVSSQQKEKDLELAARIGQGLLTRNKALEDRLLAVESELTSAHDTVTQLRHDLLLKSELLQIYSNDFDDNSPDGGEFMSLSFFATHRKTNIEL